MFKPLSGLRVVDLTQVLAGPYAAYQLALMGAEVIKVETPQTGDWGRVRGDLPETNALGMGLTYLTQNANKKSVTLDLKTPEGLEAMKRLIASADVFIENFRPGAIERLGLSYDVVRQLKPGIVYCSISAFGQDGAFRHRPAYDHVIQGMCGIMRTTGTEQTGPTKVGSPFIDYATGLNAAFAITAGLHEVKRTGESVHLDVAMLDTSMLLMASLMTSHLTADWMPRPAGNEAWSLSPSSGAFETSDGLLMIAANNDKQFRALCKGLDREDILTDPRWADPANRAKNAPALRAELVQVFLSDRAEHWEAQLDAAGVPAARVRSLDETLAEPHMRTRRIAAALPWEHGKGALHLPTLGFKANGQAVAPTELPPELGRDTRDVLTSLGYSDGDLQAMEAAQVI
ncbi:CaiB/BaiF CoA-transferase family protein [Pararhodobacter sp. CCB-MM2]|uniref:CaiB/BaiF CoA transferase family protein n=1 Tax=Pararhodobacter sp. CCB-MM2 TaxID=1786003 RepID=UPI0008298648|nr:CoA transferase [Pararhodobacter sp. CCB-MM2]